MPSSTSTCCRKVLPLDPHLLPDAPRGVHGEGVPL